MIKRAIFVFLIAALILLAGCAGGSGGGFSEKDFYLSIAGADYRCGEGIDRAVEGLGPEYGYAEGLSCAYDSVDKTYSFDSATFYTNPMPDGDLISEIYSQSPEAKTSGGISPGASKEEVLAAHGEGADDLGNLIVYRVPDREGARGRGSLCFEIENDLVIAIFITTEPM
ncbi:MAG: hypothetical protein LBU86_01565 [Oscillospiraceae bacterium]|jgi:hypothetical protein|nr:hypothetical protein [Oscillospiraceae bacterium]